MDELDQKIDDALGTAKGVMKATLLVPAVLGLLEEEDPDNLREACEWARTDPTLQEFFSAEATDLMANIACAKLHGKDPMEFLR